MRCLNNVNEDGSADYDGHSGLRANRLSRRECQYLWAVWALGQHAEQAIQVIRSEAGKQLGASKNYQTKLPVYPLLPREASLCSF
jgi:hypothetical protein